MTDLLLVVVRQSLVLLLALGATALLRRRSAAVRHWMLTVAITCALAMPVLGSISPRWHLRVPHVSTPVTQAESTPAGAARASRSLPPREAFLQTPRPRRADLDALLTAALAIWMTGALFGFVALAVAVARLARVTRSAPPVNGGPIRAMADDLSRRLGLRHGVTVRRSEESTLAFTWGLMRPQIVLPATADDWSSARLAAVLRHELAHVARWDWAIQVAAAIGLAAWWFNPLVWVACRQLRRESELAADDVVLGAGVDGAEYATHLVEIARHAAITEGPWLTAPSIVHRSTLEGRIRAMLNDDLDRRPLTHRTRALALALALGIALPIAGLAATAAPEEAAQAAAGPGTVSGTIYDQAGGLLPGVAVVLVHTQTTGRYEAATDPKGGFAFRNLPPGDYELTTTLPGFNTVKNLLRLASEGAVKRYVTMPLGAIEETISVTPDPPGTKPRADPRITREIPEPKVPGPCTGAIGGCIKMPRKMVHVSPRYPVELAATGKSGVVEITGRIGIDGYMADMRLRDNAGEDATLQAAALEAVRQWEFEPTRLNNAPVETNISVHVYFNSK